MKYYFIKNKTKSRDIIFKYTPSVNNLADILTKLLACKATHRIIALLGLRKKNRVYQTKRSVRL